jgi:hypothetical protein
VGLVAVVGLAHAARAVAEPIKLVQPFHVHFTRYDAQVIALLSGHPMYDAVEVFYADRPGQPPLIWAIVTLLDGFQIDHVNDPAFAAETRSHFRPLVHRDIDFQQTLLAGGGVRVTARFESYRGEDVVIDTTTISAPSPAMGGLIDPGNHAQTTSLPLLRVHDTAAGSTESRVLIDGVPQPLVPGPAPGTVGAFYAAGFDLGVIAADVERLKLIEGPEELRVGAAWTFVDSNGLRRYELIAVQGAEVVIRRTTGQEEIIVARVRAGRPDLLEIRTVRATGLPAALNTTPPPPPAGFTLDLTTPGRFSISLDERADLFTGIAEATYDRHQVSWILRPTQPSWAAPRVVNARGWFDRSGDVLLVTTIGERGHGPRSCDASSDMACASSHGSSTTNDEPWPSSLSAEIVPACASAIWRAMNSPSPSPP